MNLPVVSQSLIDLSEQEADKLKERLLVVYKTLMSHKIHQRADSLIWTIPNFLFLFNLQKRSQGKGGLLEYLDSPKFSIPPGYTFRLRLFTNGIKEANGKFMSLYVQMFQSSNDDVLHFPFKGVFTFTLMDLNVFSNKTLPRVHHVKRFKTSAAPNSKCFQKPTTTSSGAYGLSNFVAHEKLYESGKNTLGKKYSRFVVNNTIVIGTTIRFDSRIS